MLRTTFLTLIYLSFFGFGLAAPFVLTLGYAWVDTFRPQEVAYYFLNQLPVAQIMGAGALASYFLMDRRSPPRLTGAMLLTLSLAVWVTASMLWAVEPIAAWSKWDWAFKTMMVSAFLPLVIRSRVQIEAFVQTYVFSLAANFIPFAAKVLIAGGGYGRNLGLEAGNGNLSEGELLSTVVLMAIPLALHLGRHTQLLPKTRLVKFGYLVLAGCALVTALGTYERSALVGMVGLGGYMFMRSRHKLLLGLCLAVICILIAYTMSATWTERIATIQNPHADSSAMMRLLVWDWTYKFVLEHPFGGGLNFFVIDRLVSPEGTVYFSRASQSIYFELFGGQGWIGLALFLGLLGGTFLNLRRLTRRTRSIPDLLWCADLSEALQAGLVVFMACGAFVDIAFQPELWYFVALSVSLSEYVRRVEQEASPRARWPAQAAPMPAAGSSAPWRRQPAWRRS